MQIRKQFIIIVLPLLGAMACNNKQNKFKTDVAVPVSVEQVGRGAIEEVFEATGTVLPFMSVTLKNEAAGDYYLRNNPKTGQPFKMGDEVKKNQVIIRFEDKEYENRMNIEGERLDLNISEKEFQKQQALYEKGGVTLRELVNSEKQFVTAKNNYENAELGLAKLNVVVPFDGVITSLPYFSPGVRLAANQEVVELMDFDDMILDLRMPENQMNYISLGQGARIMNYALPDDTLEAEITQISPAIDIETRTFMCRLQVPNKQLLLKPGMFVKTEIVTAKADSVIVIPKEVVLSRSEGKVVFVASKDRAVMRVVQTGLENAKMVEVIKGLKPKERLIIKGYETLKDRSKISVLK